MLFLMGISLQKGKKEIKSIVKENISRERGAGLEPRLTLSSPVSSIFGDRELLRHAFS